MTLENLPHLLLFHSNVFRGIHAYQITIKNLGINNTNIENSLKILGAMR